MALLAFDTSGPFVAVALLKGGAVTHRLEEMARGQGERLMPILEEVLEGAGLVWRDLDALAVGTGPGNFTGIRIGVSAARGLALALRIEAIGVSAFDTTARLAGTTAAAVPATQGRFYVFDAGSMEAPVLSDAQPEGMPLSSAYDRAEHIEALARLAHERRGAGTLPKPLYVRPADAAPPRDAPPVLID
ncbi:MAG: tRNA (adenosine(37)-N6)-threonylcarbamoyltransferase complex dimerization subunit type 1 TsaB [Pseudomonadota bacterium]